MANSLVKVTSNIIIPIVSAPLVILGGCLAVDKLHEYFNSPSVQESPAQIVTHDGFVLKNFKYLSYSGDETFNDNFKGKYNIYVTESPDSNTRIEDLKKAKEKAYGLFSSTFGTNITSDGPILVPEKEKAKGSHFEHIRNLMVIKPRNDLNTDKCILSIAHEATHAEIYKRTKNPYIPAGINEGFATQVQSKENPYSIPSFDRIENFDDKEARTVLSVLLFPSLEYPTNKRTRTYLYYANYRLVKAYLGHGGSFDEFCSKIKPNDNAYAFAKVFLTTGGSAGAKALKDILDELHFSIYNQDVEKALIKNIGKDNYELFKTLAFKA